MEGLAASGRTDAVRIDLYDETGSEYPMQITANVEGGLFRAVLPKGDWRWIHVSRPGLSDMPTVGESVPERLKLGRAAVRNCFWMGIFCVVFQNFQTMMMCNQAGYFVKEIGMPPGMNCSYKSSIFFRTFCKIQFQITGV